MTSSTPTVASTNEVVNEVVVEESKTSSKKPRRVVTSEVFLEELKKLQLFTENKIKALKELAVASEARKQPGGTGVKDWTSVLSMSKKLQQDFARYNNTREKRPRRQKSETPREGGFLKPVQVTPQMAKFAGWTDGELHSRVDVTKSICKHIADKKLQMPEQKRSFVPDDSLRSLLNMTEEDTEPLTYISLQKRLKHLFVPTPKKVPSA